MFDTTNLSVSSVLSISQYPVCCKAKSLHILTSNSKSFWNKKEEIETFVQDNDIDIVIGSESNLNQRVSKSGFLPYEYTGFRTGWTNGWGGVLLMVKSKLICEQISISEGPELVAIKIETFKHTLIVAACYHPPKYSKEQ